MKLEGSTEKLASDKWNTRDEFVADSSLIKPKYLIQLKAKGNENI